MKLIYVCIIYGILGVVLFPIPLIYGLIDAPEFGLRVSMKLNYRCWVKTLWGFVLEAAPDYAKYEGGKYE